MCFFSCKDAAALNKAIDIKVDGGKWYHMKRKQKEKTADKPPPTVLPITGWKEFQADKLPTQFNYGHVYHWLVESMPSSNTFSDDTNSDKRNLTVCRNN